MRTIRILGEWFLFDILIGRPVKSWLVISVLGLLLGILFGWSPRAITAFGLSMVLAGLTALSKWEVVINFIGELQKDIFSGKHGLIAVSATVSILAGCLGLLFSGLLGVVNPISGICFIVMGVGVFITIIVPILNAVFK